MRNPFESRAQALNGPSQDLVPVTPADDTDLAQVAVALFVETAGTIAFMSVKGELRSVKVGDFSILPVGVRQVQASGTTASGIHAFMVT
ncbi:hypothetical protein DL237_18765 [Pseudooceanicola sediminis]|uniref:Uncharacterized protein n=1 Tax=Pseudooceanicola sediminis TaxID=2211117 RepID=A0A399IXH7_9RHOB|nr:hypothetical protein [Pseudooceanicola sediminis]KAA2311709.1 hypothetical protein E0K93_19805 [Puniceibacterium sp. HSS470]RII37127.1 hypothetical protein DL237_18765 [Pseudooceanicola sediminis]